MPPDPISSTEPASGEAIRLQEPPSENPVWNLVDVSATVGFAFVATLVSIKFWLVLLHIFPRFHNLTPEQLFDYALVRVAALVGTYVLLVAFMVLLVRLKGRKDFLAAISWNAPGARQTLLTIAGGVGMMLVSTGLSVLVARWEPSSLPMEQLFKDTFSTYTLTLFSILVAPFVEELFFRGFLYPAMARVTGVGAAVAVTALAFTLLHGAQLGYSWAALTPILAVGIILTTVRATTRSVATTVYLHMAYNAAISVVEFIGTHGFHQFPHS